jgi:transmembrane 9 superfamily protein 2/4
MQILLAAFLTLIAASLGFLSPPNGFDTLSTVLVMYIFMGIAGGLFNKIAEKLVGGTQPLGLVFIASALFPGVCHFIGYNLNTISIAEGSS